MNDDEKTARGGLRPQRAVPPVRSTAPVGTPVDPAAPQRIPSDRPAPGLTPPRTVGGHTARLNVDAQGSGHAAPEPQTPAPAADHADAGAAGSRTVGGTMRLAPGGAPHAPIADTAPMAAVPDTMGETPKPPAQPLPPRAPPPVAGNVAEGIAWLSPLPVAVGLVFFAVGSMITLAADGRFGGRAAPAASVPTVAATTAPAPSVTATATAAAAHSAVPAATASATASASSPTPAPRPHGAGQPPRSSPQPKGKQPARPALPF